MYVDASPLAGKIVGVRGLGAIDIAELPVGDLAPCAAYETGAACRGMTAGGIAGHCTCVNLSEIDTALELKQLLTDVTGISTVLWDAWTGADELVLLAWAESATGLYLPDVNRWWRSGLVGDEDLLRRTPGPGLGRAYPSGAGILALLDEAGCIELGDGLPHPGPCARYPRLRAALARYYSIVSPDPEDGISVYPPVFGESSAAAPPIEPGGPVPTAATLRVSVGGPPPLQWLPWSLAGAALAATAWGVWRSVA